MSFTEFEQAIKAPALQQVAQHWNEARASRRMPDWSDIRPASVAAQLNIIWSYRYDRSRDVLIGRLAGDQIEKVFGKTFRGTPMEVLYPPDQYPRMFKRFRRVVCEPALYKEEGKVFQVVDHYGCGERIAMPLSSDGEVGDGIIGATLYEVVRVNDAKQHDDDVRWFASEPPGRIGVPSRRWLEPISKSSEEDDEAGEPDESEDARSSTRPTPRRCGRASTMPGRRSRYSATAT